ncbi:MAG: response regulator transcription factor [Bdellovibrionales bacterium]|nr:response regulator transcription factor [Bdellovibrionales bacterium]
MDAEYILLLEDDLTFQTLVKESLPKFNWVIANSIKEARALLEIHSPKISAILVDIQLPDGDGLRFLNDVTSQEKYSDLPCLILTGQAQVGNKVTAFSLGAEDFIEKPFDPIELEARISAKIRKVKKNKRQDSLFSIGNISVDMNRQKAFLIGANGSEEDLDLTVKEFQLILLFTKNLERVYSREQILDSIWKDISISDRTVDSHISHLRKKIAESQVEIKSLKGVGYLAEIKK